jgi:DNA-binding CsgD family transcriptional regulator
MNKPNGQRLIKKRSEQKRKRILKLFMKGYSYRQIMRALGFKSTTAVAYYLKKGRKPKSK